MNYISEIRAFYDWQVRNNLSSAAVALWHTLMYFNNGDAIRVNNDWYWKVEFTVKNKTLETYTSISPKQLDLKRNELITKGRIQYRKSSGSKSGTYSMIPVDCNMYKQTVIQTDIQSGLQKGIQSNIQMGIQVWTQITDKHSRVLYNNYNANSNSNKKINDDVDENAREEKKSEKPLLTTEYLTDRNLNPDVYFGISEELKVKVELITKDIFKTFTERKPQDNDISKVFNYIRESKSENDEWRIDYPKRKIDLLFYAFEQAQLTSNAGNWRYIDGIMQKLSERGINSLAEAEEYDNERR